MKIFLRPLMALLLAGTCAAAASAPMHLTNSIPRCHMPPGKVLPDKYYKLEKGKNAFGWVAGATRADPVVGGAGYERVDGSDMHDWLTFYRIDLNGDRICDWYLEASAPFSTGGDRGVINTLYIGTSSGWTRIGAEVPRDKPDSPGFEVSGEQAEDFVFGEDPSVIMDSSTRISYIIAALNNRNADRYSRPGYRIFAWDADKKSLRLLDKWEPGSRAAEVYAFFKVHGAATPSRRSTGKAVIHDYEPEVETFELELICEPDGTSGSSDELEGRISKYLLARCKKH
ncbi:hypothetical protein GJV26_26135 [Massilia dura]|uniref:Uncharacterized protein n=1 Tax=Pseudoduganella dura TaxID=321982 RepID=A0A6I3XRG2_9BURK|nr:hypothetical protein [Pseudoduganella dura]